MAERHLVRIIDDGDVAHALERVRRGHAGAADAEIFSDYIAGLKAIIQQLQAGVSNVPHPSPFPQGEAVGET